MDSRHAEDLDADCRRAIEHDDRKLAARVLENERARKRAAKQKAHETEKAATA